MTSLCNLPEIQVNLLPDYNGKVDLLTSSKRSDGTASDIGVRVGPGRIALQRMLRLKKIENGIIELLCENKTHKTISVVKINKNFRMSTFSLSTTSRKSSYVKVFDQCFSN